MRVIIAGSRDIPHPYFAVCLAIMESTFEPITEVVSGTARGVDKAGEEWAKAENISIKQFPADWDAFGKQAGILRNLEMAQYADALIAVWDAKSSGTKHMINAMKKYNKPTYIHYV